MLGPELLSLKEERFQLQKKLGLLSQKHTLKLLYELNKEPTYMKALSESTGIPYTTVQKRVREMADANLVQIMDQVDEFTGKAIKKVRVNRFQIQVDMSTINQIMEGKSIHLLFPE